MTPAERYCRMSRAFRSKPAGSEYPTCLIKGAFGRSGFWECVMGQTIPRRPAFEESAMQSKVLTVSREACHGCWTSSRRARCIASLSTTGSVMQYAHDLRAAIEALAGNFTKPGHGGSVTVGQWEAHPRGAVQR